MHNQQKLKKYSRKYDVKIFGSFSRFKWLCMYCSASAAAGVATMRFRNIIKEIKKKGGSIRTSKQK
jgi:hypothetical protein